MITDKEIESVAEQTYSHEGKVEAFIEGAQWADRKITKKVCDWLSDNWVGDEDIDDVINGFIKDIEYIEEQ